MCSEQFLRNQSSSEVAQSCRTCRGWILSKRFISCWWCLRNLLVSVRLKQFGPQATRLRKTNQLSRWREKYNLERAKQPRKPRNKTEEWYLSLECFMRRYVQVTGAFFESLEFQLGRLGWHNDTVLSLLKTDWRANWTGRLKNGVSSSRVLIITESSTHKTWVSTDQDIFSAQEWFDCGALVLVINDFGHLRRQWIVKVAS